MMFVLTEFFRDAKKQLPRHWKSLPVLKHRDSVMRGLSPHFLVLPFFVLQLFPSPSFLHFC